MKTDYFHSAVLVLLVGLHCHSAVASERQLQPEFEFDVWASPPSPRVYTLTSERVVQLILFTIEENALPPDEIASRAEIPIEDAVSRLKELSEYGLVRQDGPAWVTCIPLYTANEIAAGEKLGMTYAEKESGILRGEIPQLRNAFEKTRLSQYFAWDEVSLILVGGLLADLCAVDRIPFMPGHAVEGLQLPLLSASGKRWGYEGFEKLPNRFPSRKWKFYHNVFSKYSGGMARFGHYAENRPNQPSRPEGWMRFEQGKILLALADGPQSYETLLGPTGLQPGILTQGLEALQRTTPPAVIVRNGTYQSKIPILCEADLALLLPECDRVAKIIVEEVVRPHWADRIAEGKATGSRWPLPVGTYVRDKALQMLVEKGQIGPEPSAPVTWNFGVWGWQGFLRMHADLSQQVEPDPLLLTPPSETESQEIVRLNSLKERLLQGESLVDVSTPAHAYLTRISAYANSDIGALKRVETPADRIDMAYLENVRNQGWLDYISKVDIRRVPPVPSDPKDGDLSPVFTVHERGYEEAYVFFYFDEGWRYLGNTYRDGRWRAWAEETASKRVELPKK